MSGFFCLYIAQFPAWVWEQSTSKLQGKAFAVLERGRIMAASPPALNAGVKVGMSSARAEAIWHSSGTACGSLEQVARDVRREELAWSEVQRVLYGLTPKVEPIERGLLFADLDSSKSLSLMRGLDMRGGYAQDRATAQVAAVSAPPATTRSIKAGRERAFADQLPLEALSDLGLCAATLARLTWFGWTRLGQVRALSRRQLEEQFGAEGTLLFHCAQGARASRNLRPVSTWAPPPEIVARIEFDIPVREPSEWDGALDELLNCACEGLGGQQAQTLEIEAGTPVRAVLARRVLKEPLSNPHSLRRPTENALRHALETLLPLPPIVQCLTLRLGGLVSAPVQETLFIGSQVEKEGVMGKVVERLESRFAGRTGRYSLCNPHSPFPEDTYCWVPPQQQAQDSISQDTPVRGRRRRGEK